MILEINDEINDWSFFNTKYYIQCNTKMFTIQFKYIFIIIYKYVLRTNNIILYYIQIVFDSNHQK